MKSLIPHNYSLIHQTPGVPLTNERTQIYHLNPGANQQFSGQESLVTETLLL